MPEIYTVQRDGQRPVRFTGERIAEESGHWTNGKDNNRFYSIALYQMENRRWLVSWQYTTRWQGESAHNKIETYPTLDEAISALEAFSPLAWIEGYKHLLSRHPEYETHDQGPGGYRARQTMLEENIAQQYAALVSALCQAIDIAESW